MKHLICASFLLSSLMLFSQEIQSIENQEITIETTTPNPEEVTIEQARKESVLSGNRIARPKATEKVRPKTEIKEEPIKSK